MPADPALTPRIIQVAEGFYIRQAVDNIAWIDLGEYSIVVDALEQPQLEEEIFEAIRATLHEPPVQYVLNTHTHYDHVALNDAFQHRGGAEIINQHTTEIPERGRLFEGSRREALLLPMGGCHTDEDCIVWITQDRALFVGDIFGWGLIPLERSLDDQSAALLLDTYDRLIQYDAAVVVPGHGPICATAELRRWVEYFHWLIDQTTRACEAGRKDRDILRDLAPPDDMKGWWRFLQWKHEDSLGKVLAAARSGRLKG